MSRWSRAVGALSTAELATWSAIGGILFVLVLAGPVGGVDLTGEPTTLGEGNASVTVVEPSTDTFSVSPGRFGTNVTYLRIPDAVIDVERVSGQPRVVYLLTIPNLSIDKEARRYIESTGRLRVPLADRALQHRPEPGTYEGRMLVRVQSFGYDNIVLDQSVEVRVG